MKIMWLKRLYIIALVGIISPVWVSAQQSDEALVLKQIETLFDGMRAGDSSAVSKVFLPNATMQSISKDREGKTRLSSGSLAGFKNAVGTPHDQVWDERVANIKINVDGDMASAWVPYSFYLGDKFSHCGVNSFLFIRSQNGWKALSITDTRRGSNCAEEL